MTFCFTVAGALLAFLWFNAYPAEIIMGDAGALGLGATLAVVALMLGQVLLLPIVGCVFAAVTISVILQVGSSRLRAQFDRLGRWMPIAPRNDGGQQIERAAAISSRMDTLWRMRYGTLAESVPC